MTRQIAVPTSPMRNVFRNVPRKVASNASAYRSNESRSLACAEKRSGL